MPRAISSRAALGDGPDLVDARRAHLEVARQAVADDPSSRRVESPVTSRSRSAGSLSSSASTPLSRRNVSICLRPRRELRGRGGGGLALARDRGVPDRRSPRRICLLRRAGYRDHVVRVAVADAVGDRGPRRRGSRSRARTARSGAKTRSRIARERLRFGFRRPQARLSAIRRPGRLPQTPGCAPRAPLRSSRCRRRPSRPARRAASARSRAARRGRRARSSTSAAARRSPAARSARRRRPAAPPPGPAPQISTLKPRPAADRAYSDDRVGSRGAPSEPRTPTRSRARRARRAPAASARDPTPSRRGCRRRGRSSRGRSTGGSRDGT